MSATALTDIICCHLYYCVARLSEWREYKLIYKRYASLFFITCVEKTDNELITLEIIHQFVEVGHARAHTPTITNLAAKQCCLAAQHDKNCVSRSHTYVRRF